MGSWSEYCGISQITITAGTPCVFIALKKDNKLSRLGGGGGEWFPALPPIFGHYNDYGAIESVEDTFGARIIKTHFGIDAEKFVEAIERKSIGSNSDVKLPVEAAKWSYMFVHRKVWDFMASYLPGANDLDPDNSYDIGAPWLLRQLGFEYKGESGDKRYKQLWEKGSISLKSDGTWVNDVNRQGIYYLSSLEKLGIEIPAHIKNFPAHKNWRLMLDKEDPCGSYDTYGRNGLGYIAFYMGLGKDLYGAISRFSEKPRRYSKDELKEIKEKRHFDPAKFDREQRAKFSAIERKYLELIKNYDEAFIDSIVDYVTVTRNMFLFSKTFEPIMRYITPQFGEQKAAQPIFEMFAEVNKAEAGKYDDDDDDYSDEEE